MTAQTSSCCSWHNLALVIFLSLIGGYVLTAFRSGADNTSLSGQTDDILMPEKEHGTDRDEAKLLVQTFQQMLPAGFKITKVSVGERTVDIDGEAPDFVSIHIFRDQVFRSDRFSNWIWETPHPYDKAGVAIFRFCARFVEGGKGSL